METDMSNRHKPTSAAIDTIVLIDRKMIIRHVQSGLLSWMLLNAILGVIIHIIK
jgi:hypothetical protein